MSEALPTYIELGLTDSETTGKSGRTCMTAVSTVVPVALPQVSVYEYDLITGRDGIVCEPPAVALAPPQSPVAVQKLGVLVTVQLSVMPDPGVIGPMGLLERATIGRLGGGSTAATVVVAKPVPPSFRQVRVYE